MTTHRDPLDSALETIGRTPLVRIHAAPAAVPVYAKLESFNPGASIKDRIGRYMLERMLEAGDLEPGGTVIEATAGNTGIGLALAANQLGLDAIFVVPERFSQEKQTLMAALGARIENTPTEDGIGRAIERAEELTEEIENAAIPDQFSNELNAEAHYETTGPEIHEALDGQVGAVVAGCGTAGTLMGIARYARDQHPDTHVTAVEPEGSVYRRFLGEDVEDEEYKIEGIGTGDHTVNQLFDPDLVDEIVQVHSREAQAELKRLAREEGHLVASSAGAASVAALDVAERIASGTIDVPYDTVATVFPDSSERYLSKGIYEDYEDWGG